MLLSSSEDIAIKAVTYIAAVNGKRNCSINEIAHNEGVPREYLAKILKKLVQSGLLLSKKGVFGGYVLTKPRSEISFLDVVEATDGDFVNMFKYNSAEMKTTEKSPTNPFWKDVYGVIRNQMGKMTFEKIEYSKFYQDLK